MTKRLTVQLLALTLILAVSALGVHALVHGLDSSDNGQHCQVCHVGRVATPVPAAVASLSAPTTYERHFSTSASALDPAVVGDQTSPRGPPRSTYLV